MKKKKKQHILEEKQALQMRVIKPKKKKWDNMMIMMIKIINTKYKTRKPLINRIVINNPQLNTEKFQRVIKNKRVLLKNKIHHLQYKTINKNLMNIVMKEQNNNKLVIKMNQKIIKIEKQEKQERVILKMKE